MLQDCPDVEIEGLRCEDLYIKENVGKLHFVKDCRVTKSLSFTGVQAQEVNLTGLVKEEQATLTLKDTNFEQLQKEGKYITGREGEPKKFGLFGKRSDFDV
jgi:hypothetical protein